jgi:isocitrate dehydrogenase
LKTIDSMGEKITIKDKILTVPDNPVIPHIEGDGIGPDVWRAAQHVFDSVAEKAYKGKRKIDWMEVTAGEKSFKASGSWLPAETIDAFKEYLVGIKGPLTTPIGKGIRSLNVALRQALDLYVCLRPVKYYGGIDTPLRRPDLTDMVIFRENTEDIYTGIEFKTMTEDNKKLLGFIQKEFPEQFEKIRFGTLEKCNDFLNSAGLPLADHLELGIGLKIISRTGTERLMIAAVKYAIEHKRRTITIVHKGNIMKFTAGAFRDWAYEIAEEFFKDDIYTWTQWERTVNEKGKEAADKEKEQAVASGKVLIKDAIADNALQQVLTNPEEFDVIATENLIGDYLSDAIAAQVGGIGIAPGGNINYVTGAAIFEATHGTAPGFAGKNMVNPSSLILSGMMMLQYLGWHEAADMIESGIRKAVASKRVTFDFARQMVDATTVSTSEFAEEIVKNF